MAYTKEFFFKFDKPVEMKAVLKHEGSNAVMMLFMGEDKRRSLWTRKDAKKGEELVIERAIGQPDLDQLGDKYWSLKVTNFGRSPLTGTLDLEVKPLD